MPIVRRLITWILDEINFKKSKLKALLRFSKSFFSTVVNGTEMLTLYLAILAIFVRQYGSFLSERLTPWQSCVNPRKTIGLPILNFVSNATSSIFYAWDTISPF